MYLLLAIIRIILCCVFPNVNFTLFSAIDFWVLSTDYSTFALTYGCENVGTTQRRGKHIILQDVLKL